MLQAERCLRHAAASLCLPAASAAAGRQMPYVSMRVAGTRREEAAQEAQRTCPVYARLRYAQATARRELRGKARKSAVNAFFLSSSLIC